MKPEQSKRIAIVGTFVLLGLLTLLVGILIMGKQRQTFERMVTLKAVFPDVNGLLEGNNVWISGVKVGNVKKLKLNGSLQVEVIMNIERKSLSFIRKDAKARIGSDGLIGNRIVVIYGGTLQAASVQPGDILRVEKAISTDEMLHTLQENNRNLQAITGNMKRVTQKLAEGEGTIGMLLNDASLHHDLRSAAGTLKEASLNVQTLTAHIAGYSSKLNEKGSLANDLVTDTSIFSGLRTTIDQIKEVSKTAKDVVGDIKNLRGELDSSSGLIGTLIRDKEASANMKGVLRNLQSGTERLDENMEALQHSFLFRRYFKRKWGSEAKKINAAGKNEPTSRNQVVVDSLNHFAGIRSDSAWSGAVNK